MSTVAVHPPKTPVTKGSSDVATASLPNLCKMPGPPAPFVPTVLPNIGDSGKQPDGYSKSVDIEGQPVAIEGASFGSSGDIASKGTGGGVTSNNTEGPTKFIGPGSPTVQIEGKNVHLLGEQMMNNCGPGGSPQNAATLPGNVQPAGTPQQVLKDIARDCDKNTPPTDSKGKKKSCLKLGTDKHACCEGKIQAHRAKDPPDGKPPIEGESGYKKPQLNSNNRPAPNANGSYPAPVPTNSARPNLAAAFALGGKAIAAAFAALRGNCYPDAAILNADGSKTFVDFKFPCPKGHPSGKGTSKGGTKTTMSPQQQGHYDGLGFGSGNGPAMVITP